VADVFISYASADRSEAEGLATLLASHGLDVWWDNKLYAGDDFHELILREISNAKAVVVIWSDASINSRWVRGEANLAAEHNKLIPCHLADFDLTRVPLHLRELHCAPLAEQRGLISAILARVGHAPPAEKGADQTRSKSALEHEIDDELAAEESLEAYNDGVWAGSPSEAISNYDKAISLNPQFAEAYGNRGRANYEVGSFTEAVRDLTHAIRLKTRDRSTVEPSSGGNLFQRLDAILIDSNNLCLARAFYNRALAQLALGDYASAIADARRSI
jgi:tetratricopeptide (TPR) repeat protein